MTDQELLRAASHMIASVTGDGAEAPPAEVANTLAAYIDRLGYGGLLAAAPSRWGDEEVEEVSVAELRTGNLVLVEGQVSQFVCVLGRDRINVLSPTRGNTMTVTAQRIQRLTEAGRIRYHLGSAPAAA